MKNLRWRAMLAFALLMSSALLYSIQYRVMRDARLLLSWLLGSVAFVPINVLLVTLVIDQLITSREKKARLEKLNMMIGAFYSEVGIQLLRVLSALDPQAGLVRTDLLSGQSWSRERFASIGKAIRRRGHRIELDGACLGQLNTFFSAKREFLLRMLENPSLLEHESFSQLLWAVFHLAEELAYREDVYALPEEDRQHLHGDLERVYMNLVLEWLAYMQHVHANYPYLFSLGLRTNPFDPDASASIGAQAIDVAVNPRG